MSGAYNFAYQTAQTSTVLANSELVLSQNLTFSYDPQVVASQNLLAFSGDTSVLVLSGANLHSTVTGMQLSNGILLVTTNSQLSSESQTLPSGQIINPGITIGDGISPLDDFITFIFSGATLELSSGHLSYQNLSPFSYIAQTNTSLIQIDDNTRFSLYQNINLGPGILVFGNGPGTVTYERTSAANINGSIYVHGTVNYVILS